MERTRATEDLAISAFRPKFEKFSKFSVTSLPGVRILGEMRKKTKFVSLLFDKIKGKKKEGEEEDVKNKEVRRRGGKRTS